jgi:hypothetical protein
MVTLGISFSLNELSKYFIVRGVDNSIWVNITKPLSLQHLLSNDRQGRPKTDLVLKPDGVSSQTVRIWFLSLRHDNEGYRDFILSGLRFDLGVHTPCDFL